MKKWISYISIMISVLLAFSGCSSLQDAEAVLEMLEQEEQHYEEQVEDIKVEDSDDIEDAVIQEEDTVLEENEEGTEVDTQEPSFEEEPVVSEEEAEQDSSGEELYEDPQQDHTVEEYTVVEGGSYTTKEEVALYIHLFGELPVNFITKNEAKELGWVNKEGNLHEVAPGMSIGGDRYGNYEQILPNGKYKECDINYHGGYRGDERLVYSQDGYIYYTDDHYETFTQLYPEPELK